MLYIAVFILPPASWSGRVVPCIAVFIPTPNFIFQQMCEHLDLGGHRGHVALCVISLKSPVLLCGLAMGETELGWPVAGKELCWQSEAREVGIWPWSSELSPGILYWSRLTWPRECLGSGLSSELVWVVCSDPHLEFVTALCCPCRERPLTRRVREVGTLLSCLFSGKNLLSGIILMSMEC